MRETTNVQQAQSAGQSTVWDASITAALAPASAAASAAAIAVVIGEQRAVLVCVPYDQLFGLPTALCAGLKHTASVAVLATCWTSCRLAEPPLVLQVGTRDLGL
jgi:hypothetical protein